MLADKIEHYEKTKESLYVLTSSYKKDYPYLKEVDANALDYEKLFLEQAYKNFFRDKRVGFPKFKSAKERKSYTTKNSINKIKGKVYVTIDIKENSIKLPKMGYVKAKIHRAPDEDWKLKHATISQESDGKYYVAVVFEYEQKVKSVSNPSKVLGLDYKSDGLYMDSEGNIGNNHKYYREAQKKLAKEQRKLSRMKGSKKGETKSNNYLKQLKKVNKIHRHIANQRLDNLHKISTEIANQYDVVCVENLDMKAMANKGFHNGKATMDNGYGIFLNLLEYKLADRGKYFIKVDKWYPSSQLCSNCGNKKKLTLLDRVYKCDCGVNIDRDLNAAINIKNEGLKLLSVA